ncbi:hypothetical protein LOTGIDRAFT_158014 [Lottia gigantea]|uniref:EGF-like domain-containing protein n=1 Tax=Lottia gigantea TaxID=225164 RepID=V4CFC5_LOTGI|nr:hypothetical protein LOTGIDRAFT_158014 [Lottia gigantea]ESP00720.1 hypothetical protein LOTGIDRAFT_158014 [Lottia gigantea]
MPTSAPTKPTTKPTKPTAKPTKPTAKPTKPTIKPTKKPTSKPTNPTTKPTAKPTMPTSKPTKPTTKPTKPTAKPTKPTAKPTKPTKKPTMPTSAPTNAPTPSLPTTKQPSTEPPATVATSIQCGFDKDVCGFNLASDPDSLPWLIGNSSGPTTDFSPNKGRYLYFSFNREIPSDKDLLAHMTSGKVDGHTYKCLLLRYKTSSNRSDIFNINIRDKSKTVLSKWTLSNQVINKWDLIEITLPDDQNLQLQFEGLVMMDTKGYLAIDDWHLAQSLCKEKPRCLANPCKNQGTCKESLKSYVCVCSEEFSGTNCETAITTRNPTTKKSQITARTLVTAQPLPSSSMSSKPPLVSLRTAVIGTLPTSTDKISSAQTGKTQQTETLNPGSTQPHPITLGTAIPQSTEQLPTINLSMTAHTLVTAEQITTTGSSVNETATESYGEALTKGETYALIAGGSLAVVVILSCLIARCYKKSSFKGGDIYDDTYGKEYNGLPSSTDVKNPQDSELTVLNYTTHQHL